MPKNTGPQGGLRSSKKSVRRWRWDTRDPNTSAPVRCKREQWYLIRGSCDNGHRPKAGDLVVRFLKRDQVCGERSVTLTTLPSGAGSAVMGWMRTPEDATHLQIHITEARSRALDQLELLPIADRDPKCHPHANSPRWSSFAERRAHGRVGLPETLAGLRDELHGADVKVVARPRSRQALATAIHNKTCVLDPAWVRDLKLALADVETLARSAHVIVDLHTFAQLVTAAGRADAQLKRYASPHEIMSARVEYSDTPTRGFALHDVLPFATLEDEHSFGTCVLRASRSWKRFAEDAGAATLLSSETPWENRCGDVLSAAWAVGQGEILITDLPWLVAGARGQLLAPRLARHLLRMHVGLPIDDALQYWNRWDDERIVLRDIADLTRRFAPLEALRWAPDSPDTARMGISAPPLSGTAADRHLLIQTGRIDHADTHDGVAPEPMVIFMKWLAREWRERTSWAVKHLATTRVTWQFDAAEGLRYATQFQAAPTQAPGALRTLRIRAAAASAATRDHAADSVLLKTDARVFGDGSLELQAELTRVLRRWIVASDVGRG